MALPVEISEFVFQEIQAVPKQNRIAKAALDRFTWGLAARVGSHNIAVNCLKPKNVVGTEGMRYWAPGEQRKGWTFTDKMVKCAIFWSDRMRAA